MVHKIIVSQKKTKIILLPYIKLTKKFFYKIESLFIDAKIRRYINKKKLYINTHIASIEICTFLRFVLKPQREGGGNNVYGSEIRDAIVKMKNSQERNAWILMERIWPPIIQGYMVRPGGPNPPLISELVSELGIFGVVIGYVFLFVQI